MKDTVTYYWKRGCDNRSGGIAAVFLYYQEEELIALEGDSVAVTKASGYLQPINLEKN